MGLVEISSTRVRLAAAKLPTPTKENPDSGIDAGIRKSAESNSDNLTLTVPSQLADRVNALIGPEVKPVSTETGAAVPATPPATPVPEAAAAVVPKPETKAAAKPTDKPDKAVA